jgi:hypothetical protein
MDFMGVLLGAGAGLAYHLGIFEGNEAVWQQEADAS